MKYKSITKRNVLYAIIILIAIVAFSKKVNHWHTLNVLNTGSKYEVANRKNYNFFIECRVHFKEYYENINEFKTLKQLLENEPNLHNLVYFKTENILENRLFFLSDAHFIINEHISENLFSKKDYHLKDKKDKISYSQVLKKYNLNEKNITEIERFMRKTDIQVVNRYNRYIELCWDSPIDDNSLDFFSGYLIIENIDVFESIKSNYKRLSQIDDNCFYFEKDVKKEYYNR